jgi:hypothetical protein
VSERVIRWLKRWWRRHIVDDEENLFSAPTSNWEIIGD